MTGLLSAFLALLRQRPYLSTLTVLILLLGAAGGLLWQERLAAAERHAQARQRGDAMLAALADYPRITAEVAAVDNALQFIDRNLVAERALEKNLGYFYQLEVLSRVRLRQINQLGVTPAAEGNPFKVVPFALQATGTYPQLINFLRNLESGPRLVRITSYSLGRGDPRSGVMTLDATVETLANP